MAGEIEKKQNKSFHDNKTAFASTAFQHHFSLLSEEEEIESLDMAEKILTDEGYEHYEISNYALPGYECLHNLACWRGEEYIGIGPSASSHVGLTRWTNLPDLDKYIVEVAKNRIPPRELDPLDHRLKQLEIVVFGLRLKEGISKADGKICENKLHELCKKGLMEDTGSRWRLTKRGFYLADYVGRELLADRNAE